MKNLPTVKKLANNQLVISSKEGQMFKSYDSNICFIPEQGQKLLDKKYWNYSKTTVKYLSEFLGLNKKAIEDGIENKLFELTNLN